jgi:hypothetical protein
MKLIRSTHAIGAAFNDVVAADAATLSFALTALLSRWERKPGQRCRAFLSSSLALLLLFAPYGGYAADVPATCGNGHIDAGESCETCAGDCVVHACKPGGKPRVFDVAFDPPSEMRVSSITVLLGYDSRRVSLPGEAGAESVTKRLGDRQGKAIVVTNDLGYALRAVFTRPGGIDSGRLFSIAVDACTGAPAPSTTDFGCIIEGCAAASGRVAGCGCHVTAR